MDGRELKRMMAVHDRLASVMADDRFTLPTRRGPDVRMFAVASIWALAERAPEPWERVSEILHMRTWDDFWRYIAADAPRWEPEPWDHDGRCEAPMIRRDGPCGQRATLHLTARVTSPQDGTWRIARYCKRHEDHARQAARADRLMVAAGAMPEPVPNTGGLLPCYLSWSWPDQYARARPGWKPPSYGVCADDWPVLAKVAEMKPPELRALDGDGEAVPGVHEAPSLRLVRS
jgi:hypothetical protein